MHKQSALVCAFLSFAVIASMPLCAATIYLKADASGDGSGSSWSNACTSYADALARLRELPRDEPASLLIAGGLYVTPSSKDLAATDPTVVSNLNFTIAGGYRAQSDGDLVRDPEAYQTILTGVSVANLKNAYWHRLDPVPGEFRLQKTNNILKIIDENEHLQFPEYAGDHDTFIASTSGGYIPMYIREAGTSGIVDGLKFVCFNRGSSRSGIIQLAADVASVTITNCVFTGSGPQGGCITIARSQSEDDLKRIVDCKFLYNYVTYGTLGVAMGSAKGRVEVLRCEFTGSSRQAGSPMTLIVADSGEGRGQHLVEDCVFSRNLTVFSTASSMIGSGLVQFNRCLITNNYSSVSAAGGSALISLCNEKFTSTGEMSKSLVADNYFEFKPTADSVAVFVNMYGTDREPNVPLVKDCLFRGNQMHADASAVASDYSFAAGTVGNSGVAKEVRATVIGTTFDSNTVSVVNLADGAIARKSRGIVVNGSASKSIQYGIANCTFTGPAVSDMSEILQYNYQYDTMNVVNCIFTDYDGNTLTSPFSSDLPERLFVYNCAVKNMYPVLQPTDSGAFSAISYDAIPLERVPFGVGGASIYRPAANVPDLRVTCDVATNRQVNSSYGAPDRPLTFSFRLPGGEWQSLTPKAQAVTANEKTPLEDAIGSARSFGSFTRGAVQPLNQLAENGVSLTLRTDPPLACSFSAPANQSVAVGTAITPVSVVTDKSFLGWYGGDTLFSESNPLAIPALTSNLVLTARTAAGKTALTFSLGEHATFDDNGENTITVLASAGTAFPEVPAFTVEEGWFFFAWPEFPVVVPDAEATYAARIVTKAKRIFYVAPVATGSGDGSSAENATDDLAAAYEDAGSYVGEVRLAAGTYRIASPIAAKSNVSVIGEAGAQVVLTGDLNGDDYWKTNGTAAASGPSVWDGTTFNSPNPGLPESYWTATGAVADNTAFGFEVDAAGTATNLIFRNLVFTGFGKAAFFADAGSDTRGLAFENCRFLANGTARDDSFKTISCLNVGGLAVRDSEFIGNHGALKADYHMSGVTASVERCSFSCNTATLISKSYPADITEWKAAFMMRDSSVTRNYSSGTVFISVSSSRNHGPSVVSHCNVADNYGRLVYADASNRNLSDGDYWPKVNLEFVACSFTGNRRAPLTGSTSGALIIDGYGRYYPVVFRDSYFADNVCTNNGSGILALLYSSGYHRYTPINCTFERNHVVSTAAGGCSAISSLNNIYGGILVGATLMADNEVTALSSENAADIMMAHTTQRTSSGMVVGCVIDETKYGQHPIRIACATTPMDISYSAIRGGLDQAVVGGILSTNVIYAGDALVLERSSTGPNGVRSRGLSSLSPCAGIGVPFWRGNNDCYYVRRPADVQFLQFGALPGNPTDAAAPALGLYISGPYVADAWGKTRKYGKIPPGPLNLPKSRLAFMVR